MPPPRYKVLGAMFDVRPVDHTGAVDVSKIDRVLPSINLRPSKPLRKKIQASPARITREEVREEIKAAPAIQIVRQEVPVQTREEAPALTRAEIIRELEESLNAPHDHRTILTNLGAHVSEAPLTPKPHHRPILPPKADSVDKHHAYIVSEVQRSVRHHDAPSIPPAMAEDTTINTTLVSFEKISEAKSSEVEQWLRGVKEVAPVASTARIIHEHPSQPSKPWWRKKIISAFLIFPLLFAGHYALNLKGRVMQDGSQAVHSLESAKDNLSNLDFSAASANFLLAYEDFSKAGDQLNFMGASLSGLLADLPGAGKLKSAQSMVEIGKLIADTGASMSTAMSAIAKTGLILNPEGNSNVLLSEIINPLNAALNVSDNNLKKVRVLLGDIDSSLIPEDKRATFDAFKKQFPQMQELVTQGSDFAQFLETMIGSRGIKRYVILFQNSSELRPTGGFPGSYALLTFENGRLKEYLVDDIYNIDGQLKELIIPPKQMQHITPTWAMRDANWFIDFPTSAKKISEFYKKESGLTLDGVLTFSPDMFKDVLKIIGPVEMPAYKATITSENFLATVQNEVEYGNNKKDNKPKKIIMDMAPIVLVRLYTAPHEKWLEVFNAMIAGLERKDVLMYFRDLNLQSFAMDKGFAGEVKQVQSDYLMVTMTNVKGSKTDEVTDTSMKVQTKLDGDQIRHKVVIERTHNGGSTKYGFYNKQNPAYVRVLVPRGSSLISVNGQSAPNYNPLVDYSKGFKQDADLARLERSFVSAPQQGVSVYEESGKTGFAFWMITDPGASRTVEIEYSVPSSVVNSDYTLYVQKQPGLEIKSFSFAFTKPDNVVITSAIPNLQKVGNSFMLSGKLEKDLPVNITLH